MKKLGLFLFNWLMVGFTTGTATLMGPVRWVTGHGRAAGWPDSLESVAVFGIIAVYVMAAALIAYWLTLAILRSATWHARAGIPVLVIAAVIACLWFWLNPERVVGETPTETVAGSAFTFGPYPVERQMRKLKNEGYRGIISLLHPAVVPFETKLIADGRKAAMAAGLEYIHIPMLPWVSDNSESLARLESLAKSRSGRYYVHCYLGRDRIRLAKRIVEDAEPDAVVTVTGNPVRRARGNSLDEIDALERGEIVQLADGVFLTPYPTDDEFMSYIVGDGNISVVSLLDPSHPEDLPWIRKEEQLLTSNRIAYRSLPLPLNPYDPDRALEITREVAGLQRPVVVHAFLSATSGRAPAAEAVLQAFRADVPPLPPSGFREPMGTGEVDVLAPNIAAGPRPREPDFGTWLYPRGVREFIYVGDPRAEDARHDLGVCEEAGLSCRAIDRDHPELLETLADGGPWYVYGPGLATVRPQITKRLGPAIPIPAALKLPPGEPAEIATESRIPFLRAAWPELGLWITLMPLSLVFAAAAGGLVAWLRTEQGVQTPYTRKIFHVLIFTAAAMLHFYGGLPAVVVYGTGVTCVVLYAVYRGLGFPLYEALARPSDTPRRTLFVLVPLAMTAAGGLTSNFFFGGFAYVGYLVAGWGDAVGEPVGTAWGRHRFSVPSLAGVPATRSIEGSAAVCGVGMLSAFAGLVLTGIPAPTAFAVGAVCGLAGALVEVVSHHGLDNLTIQLAASGMAWLILA